MEPVNIDFMLGGNVEQEGPKIEKKFNDITNASKNAVDAVTKTGQSAVDAVNSNIEKTKASVAKLESVVSGLKKTLDGAAPGNAKQNAVLDLNEANRSLNAQKTILSGLEQQRNSLINTQKQQAEANNKEEGSVISMVTSLYKWVVGLAAVKYALEIGKKIIESTEGASHQLELATESVSTGIDYLFKTIASGDWSNFTEGLTTAVNGARDYVNEMERLQNLKNEQKIKSSSLDIQVGEARADSYSTDPKVVKEALKRIIALQTQKLTEEANLYKQEYEIKLKRVASLNGLNEKALENTIKYYSANRKAIEIGEQYNQFSAIKSIAPSQGMNPQPGNEAEYNHAQEELKKLTAEAKKEGINLNNASKLALKFSKVSFPERNELADLLAKSQDATAAININNRRDKQRLVGIEKKEEDDAAVAAKKAAEDKNKRIKEQLDYASEIGKKRIANAFEIEQQLLNAETDGAEKSRKQADLDYRKKLSDIEIQKAEYIKKQNLISGGIDKATGKPTAKYSEVIPEVDQQQFEGMKAAAIKVRDAKLTEIQLKEKKEIDELLLMAARYSDERLKIEEDYNLKIQKLAQAGFVVQAAALAEERDKKISAVSTRLLEETDLYKMATGKQLMISKELTASLIAEMKKRIEADKTLTGEDKTKMLNKLNKADYTVNKTDNPFADLIDGVAKYKAAREAQSKTNAQTDIEGFAKLDDAANKAQKATLGAAAVALQGIGSIVSEVANTLDSLGKLSDEDKKTVGQVTGMISGAANLANGIATGNPIAIIQGSIELLTNAYQLFDVESKKNAERIANDQKKIDALSKAYDKLGEAISKAYSTDKAKLITDQTKNLEEQKKLVEDQRAAEEQKSISAENKRKSGIFGWIAALLSPETDQKKIDEYNKELDDIAKKEEANKDALIESLTGTSVSSAIDEFAQAYADAFTTGEDAAAKSADVVKNLFKTALLETLKKDLQPGTKQLMDDLSTFMSDGIITAQEQAVIDADKKTLDATAAKDQKMYDDLGLVDTSKSSAKGIQGDVKNMTEDTGSALVGQIVAMRLNVSGILANYKNSAEMMSQQIAIQQRIADNTEFCRKLDRMDSTMEYWRVNGMKVV
jgi:hypothetical protein